MSDTLKQDPIAVFIGDDLHSFLYRRYTPASMTQVLVLEMPTTVQVRGKPSLSQASFNVVFLPMFITTNRRAIRLRVSNCGSPV